MAGLVAHPPPPVELAPLSEVTGSAAVRIALVANADLPPGQTNYPPD